MSLEQAIHDHWAGGAALVALVPATRFVTGLGQRALAPPYVTLARVSSQAKLRTSDRTVDEAEFRFEIWSETLAAAKEIAAAVTARFDRTSFAATGCESDACQILRMRQVHHAEDPHADATGWRVTLTFHATATRAKGD